MKFLTIAALLAVAYAQDDEAKEGEGEAKEGEGEEKEGEGEAKKAGFGQPCKDVGCVDGHSCGKMKSTDAEAQKALDLLGELCYKSEDCGKEENGVTLACAGFKLAAAMATAALAISYTM